MARRRKTYHRRSSTRSPRRTKARAKEEKFVPRINPRLKPVLAKIGVPEHRPFVPDPFQVEAVEKLSKGDVVVSAPTGSGKTWIAEQAIAQVLARGERAWYASPLKALSNSKYAEFSAIFGPENVGILTGDRKENTSAPLIVGTTEILRNQLYDVMYQGMSLGASLVVLDEAHFLGDPDRGVVWEEVIIYLPPRVRLLLLSATVANADQIARWLTFVRDEPCYTVITDQRPVPLYSVFMFPDGELTPFLTKRGVFGKVRHFIEQKASRPQPRPLSYLPPFSRILSCLAMANMLPAIFFLKSRADCDKALSMVRGDEYEISEAEHQALEEAIAEFLEQYPFLENHPHLAQLKAKHVAAHHAGHLPHWKLLVERLMQRGLLKAIFSTSTVAAGVNFPARTVVITQSDKFDGRNFVELTATDLLQMTGRAGRRGMDKVGFVLVVPGPFMDEQLIAGLLKAEPEPIESQLHINFSMVLNLLLSHKPAEIRQLLGYSLATFQRLERSQGRRRRGEGVGGLLKTIAYYLQGSECTGPEEALVRRRRRRQLVAIRRRIAAEMESVRSQKGLWAALTRGRLFTDMFGGMHVVLRREDHGEQPGVLAVDLGRRRKLAKGRPRIDFIPLDEVTGVFDPPLELPHAGGGRALASAILAQLPAEPRPLSAPEMEALGEQELKELGERLKEVEEQLEAMACSGCTMQAACHQGEGELGRLLDRAEELVERIQQESHGFWYDFVRHLEFLRAEGFADPTGELTPDGLWASKLRLDHPVLIAQAIRTRALPEDEPVTLAALIALFVDDKEREGDSRTLEPKLKEAISTLLHAIDPMLERMRQWGFSTPPMPAAAAAAVFAWAQGVEFNDAVHIYGGAEGDLANLIYRTADNLRQLISLSPTHPELAACARQAVEMLLRPPVVVPT